MTFLTLQTWIAVLTETVASLGFQVQELEEQLKFGKGASALVARLSLTSAGFFSCFDGTKQVSIPFFQAPVFVHPLFTLKAFIDLTLHGRRPIPPGDPKS